MRILKNRPEFMAYLPDVCYKKDPPADFFWRLYSSVCSGEYKDKYLAIKARLTDKIHRPTTLKVTPEAKALMQTHKETSLRMLQELQKPRVGLHGSYLRRAMSKRVKGLPATQATRLPFATPAKQQLSGPQHQGP